MKHFFLAAMMTMAMPPAAALAQDGAAQSPVAASEPAGETAPPAPAQPKPAIVLVTLQTSEGPIVLELEKERAPLTTAAFLRNIDANRYDGGVFYRAINMAENFGLVQGGIAPLKPGQKLPPTIAHEPTTQTGLSHRTGTVSMARAEPGTHAPISSSRWATCRALTRSRKSLATIWGLRLSVMWSKAWMWC